MNDVLGRIAYAVILPVIFPEVGVVPDLLKCATCRCVREGPALLLGFHHTWGFVLGLALCALGICRLRLRLTILRVPGIEC